VSGVYNKVMNYRALDPRDTRAGLAGASATDRSVWAEFYDPITKAVHVAALEAEFERLWPEGSAGEPESVSLDEATTVSTGHGGQGFISDPAARRAVEERAMRLAEEHYRRTFSTVENTASNHPFDLCCRRGPLEVRVEVKGSTGVAHDVRLTAGEVSNAREGVGWRTDLFLVSQIRVTKTAGGPVATGGTPRVIEAWVPKDIDLIPEVYRYRVPPGEKEDGCL
jgi:hypothetical protein